MILGGRCGTAQDIQLMEILFPTWFVQRFLCYRYLADCFFPKQEEINALQLFTLLRV